MKKSFGLARVFFIGVLAVGLFGLLSFAFAGTVGVNPGHPGSEICDGFFCVAQASGIPLIGIGTTTPSASLHVNVSGQGSLLRLERADSTSGGYLNFGKGVAGGFVINTGESSSQIVFGAPSQLMDLILYGDLTFSDGTEQTTAAPGNCVTITQKKIGGSGAPQSVTATCSSGSTLTGGGCKRTPWATGSSYPTNVNTFGGIDDSWICAGGNSWVNLTAYAICCSP